MAFAQGKKAYGICDITGFRYRLRDMKKTWDGLLVGPDQWSPKSPQLDPKPKPADPQALKNPRPDTSVENNAFVVYTNVGKGIIGTKLETYQVQVDLGEVTIEVT
mgnify:FL=1|jgi:hypothetical protein|tara:strand:- start:7079 stop:7393 length:315 start_codon:yes stop_codon:yes gene_type:complete